MLSPWTFPLEETSSLGLQGTAWRWKHSLEVKEIYINRRVSQSSHSLSIACALEERILSCIRKVSKILPRGYLTVKTEHHISTAEDVVQLECLPSMPKSLGSIPRTTEIEHGGSYLDASVQEVNTGRSEVRGHHGLLCSKFKTGLGFVRPCVKMKHNSNLIPRRSGVSGWIRVRTSMPF